MKKIFSVALAATLLAAGCQKTEIINPVGNAIGFSSEMNKLTKSTGDLTTLKSQGFSVWAYYVEDDVHTAVDDKFKVYDNIDNVRVTFDDNSKWGTTEQYYWPGVGKELRFFAVSADAETIGGTTDLTTKVSVDEETREVLTIKDFTVSKDDPTVDLMVADVVQQHQDDKVVDLTFHHVLSKVEFVFKTISNDDNLKVTVNSISVANISTKGTFTTAEPSTPATRAEGDGTTGDGTNTGGTTTTYSGTQNEIDLCWNNLSEPAEFSVSVIDGGKLELTDTPVTYSTWLVLPQTVGEKFVRVNYTIGEKTFDSNFQLSTTSVPEWLPNQHVTYTVTLAPNLIKFNPSVDDWDEPIDNPYQN